MIRWPGRARRDCDALRRRLDELCCEWENKSEELNSRFSDPLSLTEMQKAAILAGSAAYYIAAVELRAELGQCHG